MSKFASVKIRDRKKIKPPSLHSLLHNQRLSADANYLLPTEYRKDNYHLSPISNATKVWNTWESEIQERYKKAHNRKMRSDAIAIEEGLIVLSTEQVEQCDPDQIWKKAQEFRRWFEKRHNTEILSLDWHRDEGIVEDGKAVLNEHIHFLYADVNMDGNKIRNQWQRSGAELREMQDKIAEIFAPLGFERGIKNKKKEYRRPAEQLKHKAEQTVAKLKDIQEANKTLRAMLKEAGARREQYAALEASMREMKELARKKQLTIEQMIERVETLKNENRRLKEEENARREKEENDRRNERERAVARVVARTKDLKQTTIANIRSAAKARQAERAAAEIDRAIKPVAVALGESIRELEGAVYKAAVKKLQNENRQLKDDLGRYEVELSEKTSQIANLEQQRVKSREEVLHDLRQVMRNSIAEKEYKIAEQRSIFSIRVTEAEVDNIETALNRRVDLDETRREQMQRQHRLPYPLDDDYIDEKLMKELGVQAAQKNDKPDGTTTFISRQLVALIEFANRIYMEIANNLTTTAPAPDPDKAPNVQPRQVVKRVKL
jgi:hypothetical protein